LEFDGLVLADLLHTVLSDSTFYIRLRFCSHKYLKGLWKGVLKDDFDLSTIDFAASMAKSNNQPLQVLLMGSATKLSSPKVKTVFLEDLPEVSGYNLSFA